MTDPTNDRAEIKRLRAALTEIAYGKEDGLLPAAQCRRIALAALTKERTDDVTATGEEIVE